MSVRITTVFIALLCFIVPFPSIGKDQPYFVKRLIVGRKGIWCPFKKMSSIPMMGIPPKMGPDRKKYINVLVIVDNQLYRDFGKNDEQIRTVILTMYKLVNRFYARTLNIRVNVVKIVLWKDIDMVKVDGEIDPFMDRLEEYQYQNLRSVYHNYTTLQMLLSERIRKKDSDVVGIVHKNGTICMPSSSLFILPVANDTVYAKAADTVHEIGHLLGITHDRENCPCKTDLRGCIMAEGENEDPGKPHTYVGQYWSNCSLVQYEKYENSEKHYCLLERPDKETL